MCSRVVAFIDKSKFRIQPIDQVRLCKSNVPGVRFWIYGLVGNHQRQNENNHDPKHELAQELTSYLRVNTIPKGKLYWVPVASRAPSSLLYLKTKMGLSARTGNALMPTVFLFGIWASTTGVLVRNQTR